MMRELDDLNVPALTDFGGRPARSNLNLNPTNLFQHLEEERQLSPRQRTVSEPNHESQGSDKEPEGVAN